MQSKTSKKYGLESLTETIRQARLAKGWSQRDLSARAHLTQAQISRIENGEVDLQVSTLIELARSLDLDLQLVPRIALVAVEAAVRSAEERSQERSARNLLASLRLWPNGPSRSHRGAKTSPPSHPRFTTWSRSRRLWVGHFSRPTSSGCGPAWKAS